MVYQIEIRHSCRSAHRLMPPYKGQCNNVHGEFYTFILIFEKDDLDENGMVFDFGHVKKILKTWIDENLDHSYVCKIGDEVGQFLRGKGMRVYYMNDNPTAENLAKLVYDVTKVAFKEIKKVGVIESNNDSIAWYE